MYLVNLIIGVLFLPLLVFFFRDKIKGKVIIIITFVVFIIGAFFAYLSTNRGFSFANNIVDIVIIQLFFTSTYILILKMFDKIKLKMWMSILGLVIVSSLVLTCYNMLFGPSESCGQRNAKDIEYFNGKYKVTHAGYQYGFMDFGSRFIVYELTSFGMEKIVGYAENATYYYENYTSLDLDIKKNTIHIDYVSTDNIPKSETIYIQKKNY